MVCDVVGLAPPPRVSPFRYAVRSMDERPPASPAARWLPGVAWAVMLAASELPEILLHSAGVKVPDGLGWGKLALLLVFLCATRAARSLRPLFGYAVGLSALFAALNLTGLARDTAWFQLRFNHPGIGFFAGYAAVFVLDLAVAGAVLAALWLLFRRREEFYFAGGDFRAPIVPVPWLGIRRPEPWRPFVPIFAGAAALCVAVPTLLGLRPSGEALSRALPLLPAVLLFAAVNAFTEEVYFRASFLSTLAGPVGRAHALPITVVFFGLAHWLHGSPPGLLGAAMTGFLAFLLGKAMLETKGLLAPWFIHFVPDVVIFASYALAFAAPR